MVCAQAVLEPVAPAPVGKPISVGGLVNAVIAAASRNGSTVHVMPCGTMKVHPPKQLAPEDGAGSASAGKHPLRKQAADRASSSHVKTSKPATDATSVSKSKAKRDKAKARHMLAGAKVAREGGEVQVQQGAQQPPPFQPPPFLPEACLQQVEEL